MTTQIDQVAVNYADQTGPHTLVINFRWNDNDPTFVTIDVGSILPGGVSNQTIVEAVAAKHRAKHDVAPTVAFPDQPKLPGYTTTTHAG